MNSMRVYPRQQGFVLITALVFLVALTLIGVAMIGLGTTGVRAVNNMQSQMEARSVAQQVIDGVISANFAASATTLDAVVRSYTVQLATGYKQYTVGITARPCMQQFRKFSVVPKDPRTATEDYKNCVQGAESYCADTLWRVGADVSEGWFGANESVVQGVSLVVDVESGTFHDGERYDTDRTNTDAANPYCR